MNRFLYLYFLLLLSALRHGAHLALGRFFFFFHDADYSEDNCPKGEQDTVAIFL